MSLALIRATLAEAAIQLRHGQASNCGDSALNYNLSVARTRIKCTVTVIPVGAIRFAIALYGLERDDFSSNRDPALRR